MRFNTDWQDSVVSGKYLQACRAGRRPGSDRGALKIFCISRAAHPGLTPRARREHDATGQDDGREFDLRPRAAILHLNPHGPIHRVFEKFFRPLY